MLQNILSIKNAPPYGAFSCLLALLFLTAFTLEKKIKPLYCFRSFYPVPPSG